MAEDEVHGTDPVAIEFAEAVIALDEWIIRGGFLPAAWTTKGREQVQDDLLKVSEVAKIFPDDSDIDVKGLDERLRKLNPDQQEHYRSYREAGYGVRSALDAIEAF